MRNAKTITSLIFLIALAPCTSALVSITDFTIHPPDKLPAGAFEYDPSEYILTSFYVKGTSNEILNLGFEIIITDNQLADKKKVICFAKYGEPTPQYSFDGLPCDYVYGVHAWNASKEGVWYALIPIKFFEDYRKDISECRAYIRYTVWNAWCADINEGWYGGGVPAGKVIGTKSTEVIEKGTINEYLDMITGSSNWHDVCKGNDLLYSLGGVQSYNLKYWEWAIDEYSSVEYVTGWVDVPVGTICTDYCSGIGQVATPSCDYSGQKVCLWCVKGGLLGGTYTNRDCTLPCIDFDSRKCCCQLRPAVDDETITVRVPSGTPSTTGTLKLTCGSATYTATTPQVDGQNVKFTIPKSNMQSLLEAGCAW